MGILFTEIKDEIVRTILNFLFSDQCPRIPYEVQWVNVEKKKHFVFSRLH